MPDEGVVTRVSISYSMPDRFGLDDNDNGLPDLRNTCEYVNNGPCSPGNKPAFRVDLVGAGTVLIRRGGETVEQHELLGDTWRWKLEGGGLAPPITRESSGPEWSPRLPEGRYHLTLGVEGHYGDGINISATGARSITVRDVLVVSIGDSYASGEGNPERRGSVHLGQVSGYEYRLDASWADDGVSVGHPALSTREGQDHQRAHRSTLSAAAQAALAIEREDERFSVTFVSVAASGATVRKGLTGPYPGVEVDVKAFYRLDDLAPQIEEVKVLVGDREIDFLVVSIGGNDMGFSNVVKALLLHDGPIDVGPSNFVCAGEYPDLTLCAIDGAIASGNWNIVESAFVGGGTFVNMTNRPGLNTLEGLYAELNGEIEDTLPDVHDVLITTYPDPTGIRSGGELQVCDRALGGITSLGSIDRAELEWARRHALVPLNRAIVRAAQTQGWTTIGSVFGVYSGHGICGDPPPYAPSAYPGNRYPAGVDPWPTSESMRWFRNARESSEIQGGGRTDSLGTLHPNEYGHVRIAEGLTDHILTLVRIGQALG